jgi:hypothetical protein
MSLACTSVMAFGMVVLVGVGLALIVDFSEG